MGSWERNNQLDKVYVDRWEKDLYKHLTEDRCRVIAQNVLAEETSIKTWYEKDPPKSQKKPHYAGTSERGKSPEQIRKEQRVQKRVRSRPAGVITRVLEDVKKENEPPNIDDVGNKIYRAFKKREYNNSALLLADYHEIYTFLDDLPKTMPRKTQSVGEVTFLEVDDLKRLKSVNVGTKFFAVVKTVPVLGISLIVQIERKKENKFNYFISDPLDALELEMSSEPNTLVSMFRIKAGEKSSALLNARWEEEFRLPIGEFDRHVRKALTGYDCGSNYDHSSEYSKRVHRQQEPSVYLKQLRANLPDLGELFQKEMNGLEKNINVEEKSVKGTQGERNTKPSIGSTIDNAKANRNK